MPRVKPTVSAVHLDTGHRDAFSRAIRAILATDLAETTMAQLVDGLPKADVAWEARGNLLTKAHPLADHEQLCSGVLEKTQALRNGFGPEMLSFDSQLFQAYSDAEMGSKDFNMRLVEMVAVSVHQIAVALFKLAPKSHTSEHIKSVTEWQKPAGWFECYGRRTWEEPLFPPPPTHFFHCAYLDFDLYPHGLADVAGYWAEDRILGGVVVFDRGQSGTELTVLVDFLLGKTSLDEFSLPLAATDENRYRLDPWDAIALYHVFRDPWERRIPLQKPAERDVRSTGDYPELQTWFGKIEETVQKADMLQEEIIVDLDDSANLSSGTGQSNLRSKPDRLWIYRQGGHLDEEAPSTSERINQEVGTTAQDSTVNFGTDRDVKRGDEQDITEIASKTCGQGAEDGGREAGDVAMSKSAGGVTSLQARRISGKRKAEDEPGTG
ncbi:hypothetical protein S40285_08269 [Stachybotrys chlorohalonatus IBT 40285]|uniref:Uncharacterized protein n=1 Tax=Stachybotrys chlorohalonatus (strain IBT 40285) TaxID=1283841 RepID=A0A084Q909_STAC4|nr:hypothetical protein S40285_08269 [Stachybotrys chlorohalonata IBT 40285]